MLDSTLRAQGHPTLASPDTPRPEHSSLSRAGDRSTWRTLEPDHRAPSCLLYLHSLGCSLHLSEPQFPHLQRQGAVPPQFVGLRIKQLRVWRTLRRAVGGSRGSINVGCCHHHHLHHHRHHYHVLTITTFNVKVITAIITVVTIVTFIPFVITSFHHHHCHFHYHRHLLLPLCHLTSLWWHLSPHRAWALIPLPRQRSELGPHPRPLPGTWQLAWGGGCSSPPRLGESAPSFSSNRNGLIPLM